MTTPETALFTVGVSAAVVAVLCRGPAAWAALCAGVCLAGYVLANAYRRP